MSKRAEEAALKAYPVEIVGYTVECRVGAKPEPQDWNEERRKCFQEGYEQAEKETIERVVKWMKKNWIKYPNPDIPTEVVVDNFIKAMEEEK